MVMGGQLFFTGVEPEETGVAQGRYGLDFIDKGLEIIQTSCH